jgi:hypothetical protein
VTGSVRPKLLKLFGLTCVTGLITAALLLTWVILFGGPSHAALGWGIGLLGFSLVAPSFVAEADLRSRPGGKGDKRIWGRSKIWGTMGFADAFAYLIQDEHRTILPRDTRAGTGA